jgi:hypothetical protein
MPIVSTIKSRRMKWAGYVARMAAWELIHYFSQEALKEETTWET